MFFLEFAVFVVAQFIVPLTFTGRRGFLTSLAQSAQVISKGTVMSEVNHNWKKTLKNFTWVISIVFPLCVMFITGLWESPLSFLLIGWQCFVSIWLLYVIVLLSRSPVKTLGKWLSQRLRLHEPVKRFKNWLSQTQHESE